MSFPSLVALEGFCGSWQGGQKRLEDQVLLNPWADHILKPERSWFFPRSLEGSDSYIL